MALNKVGVRIGIHIYSMLFWLLHYFIAIELTYWFDGQIAVAVFFGPLVFVSMVTNGVLLIDFKWPFLLRFWRTIYLIITFLIPVIYFIIYFNGGHHH